MCFGCMHAKWFIIMGRYWCVRFVVQIYGNMVLAFENGKNCISLRERGAYVCMLIRNTAMKVRIIINYYRCTKKPND